MKTKMLQPAPAVVAGGVAMLGERRRERLRAAADTWRGLVEAVATGNELTLEDCESLAGAAESLGIDELETEFNSDAEGLRAVRAAESQIAELKARDLPRQMVSMGAEIKELEERLRRLKGQREALRLTYETIGPMGRELAEKRARLPRLFPPTN